jgi:hypothetical protein
MAKFMNKPIVVDAVQLRWDNWSEMCEHAAVGHLTDGKPEGCYVDAGGHITGDSSARIGLQIQVSSDCVPKAILIAVQDDWIVRDHNGELSVCKPDIFVTTYNPLDWGSWRLR